MDITSTLVEVAINEAIKSSHKQKVGCVIFDKKKILSKGYNHPHKSVRSLKTKYLRYPDSIHAEIDAIIRARRDLKGCNLLVVRINSKKQLRLSKPCSKCMSYIKYVGIKKIFYSINEYPYIIEQKTNGGVCFK